MDINKQIQDIREGQYDLSILDGVKHETRRFVITIGQSSASKGVMFVLYSCPLKMNPYIKDTYLGTLAIDFEDAIQNARKKLGHYRIDVDIDETFGSRRENNTFPCGKYTGKTVADVFDMDYKYIFWAARNFTCKSKKLMMELAEYGEIAKDLILEENRSKSNDALPIDSKKVERELKILSKWENFYGVTFRLMDDKGNIFQYEGKDLGEKGETIQLTCKVKGSFESMGKVINKIRLR